MPLHRWRVDVFLRDQRHGTAIFEVRFRRAAITSAHSPKP